MVNMRDHWKAAAAAAAAEEGAVPKSELMTSPLRSKHDVESNFPPGGRSPLSLSRSSPMYFTPRHSPFRHPVRTPPPTTLETSSDSSDPLHPNGHFHYSHRSPWLRALVLGANDGLVSVASLMVGLTGAKSEAAVMSGIASLVAGACSMAIGEYVSVSSQRDTELGDIEKERQEHALGPDAVAHELEELTQIYVGRGLNYGLAKQVAEELSRDDPVKIHARDELGIDVDDLANPFQAAMASALAFSSGGMVPLLGGAFVETFKMRLVAIVVSTTFGLAVFGAVGARIGGSPLPKAILRVTVGGWAAMLVTYGVLHLFSNVAPA